jgi:hypothetical protein
MDPDDVFELRDELNKRSQSQECQIGELQCIRKDLKDLDRRPTTERSSGRSTKEEGSYAFHAGGSFELQFNVALIRGGVRYGVALSLQEGAFVPDDVINEMTPRVRLFNQYLREYPDRYSDLWMWDDKNRKHRSSNRRPRPIGPNLIEKERWVFYEIKADCSAKTCLREAIGQLLEYSFWPEGEQPEKMVVVGESKLNADGKEYLRRIRSRFGLPVEYERVDVDL